METKTPTFFFKTLFLTVAISWSAAGSAAPVTSNLHSQQKLKKSAPPVSPSEPAFSGSFGLSQYGSLYNREDGTKKESIDASLSLAYNFAQNYKADGYFYYSQNTRIQEGDWDDINLSINKKSKPWFSRLLYSPGLIGIVPLSKESRLLKEYLGGIGGILRFSFTPGTFINGFDLKFSASVIRNSYKYETATDGKLNSAYTSIQKLRAGYSYKNWGLNGALIHINTLSFENQLRESFVHYEELGYDFTKQFGVAIGHANIGSALKPNGQDNNILLINENSSLVYASMTVNF